MDRVIIPKHPVALDEAGTIIEDLPCKQCAYNLCGLREEGRCPECGAAVGRSLVGDYLRYAHPDWIGKVALGLRILVLRVIGVILLMCILGTAIPVITSQPSDMAWANALVLVIQFGGPLIGLIGVWLITIPDPGGDDLTDQRIRVGLRVCAAAAAITGCYDAFAELAKTTWPAAVGTASSVITTIAYFVGLFLICVHFERLAERVPDEKLAKESVQLKWALLASGGAILLGRGAGPAAAFWPALTRFVELTLGLGAMALMICMLATITLLIRLSNIVARQANRARVIWTNEQTTPAE